MHGTALHQSGFQRFKYGIYLLLAGNILLFFREEWAAAAQVLSGDASASDLVSVFSATLDTTAWVGLLLLFELETWQIPPEKLRGRLLWFLHGLRVVFYLFVLYAFYGYSVQALQLRHAAAIDIADVCAAPIGSASLMSGLDEFAPLSAADCAGFPADGKIWRLEDYGRLVLADSDTLQAARRLAWTEVINAGTWILLVLLLELDVRLKRRGELRGAVRRLLQGGTAAIYGVLLACAAWWWVAGTFLDFWDASLWLVAFAFIEMNVFAYAPKRFST